MSGHNKWSQIKHKKAKEDAKKGKAFTKLIKEITVAARSGGGDPASNPRLRLLLEKGKSVNMPQDNAVRAIKRGTGELPGVHYEEYLYEGFGPAGIAIIIDTLSDNKNRTVAELRHLFSAAGGSLRETGAVSWMFEKLGIITISAAVDEDTLLEKLFDYNIKDIRRIENTLSILCDPRDTELIKKALQPAGIAVEEANIEWVAKTPVDLSNGQEDKALAFLQELQDHEDVQQVYTNLG